jgi:hypothetical protein
MRDLGSGISAGGLEGLPVGVHKLNLELWQHRIANVCHPPPSFAARFSDSRENWIGKSKSRLELQTFPRQSVESVRLSS